MIEVTNTAPVTLGVNQAITFNDVVWKSGCCESFRNIGTTIRVGQGVYRLYFSGNIASTIAGTPSQLQIAVDGTPLPETIMISTSSVVNTFSNVSKSTLIGNRGNCCTPNPGNISVSVVNTGTTAITIGAGSVLSVQRVA